MSASTSLLLANVVLAVHAAIAVFVVAGLLLVIAGKAMDWRWVSNLWFRVAHLAAIGIVVAEAWLDLTCPLTSIESALRSHAGGARYSGGFVEHWLRELLYYDAAPWVFVVAYSAFGLAVALAWWYVPPRRRAGRAEVA